MGELAETSSFNKELVSNRYRYRDGGLYSTVIVLYLSDYLVNAWRLELASSKGKAVKAESEPGSSLCGRRMNP